MSPDKREHIVAFTEESSERLSRSANLEIDEKRDLSGCLEPCYLKGYRVVVDHPLVLVYHVSRPNYFIVQSLVEDSKQNRVVFELKESKILAID